MKNFLLLFCLTAVGCASNAQYQITEHTDTVTATGVGSTVEESKLDAFKEAIHKSLGIEVKGDQTIVKQKLASSVIEITYQDYQIYFTRFEVVEQVQNNSKFYTTIKTRIYSKHFKKRSGYSKVVHESMDRINANWNGENPDGTIPSVRPDITNDLTIVIGYYLSFDWLKDDK